VIDSTHTVHPEKGSVEIFDDRTLEVERMNAYISANNFSLLRRTPVGGNLSEQQQLLLPRGVWAYVFRNRQWCMISCPLHCM
jgi:hypothetical protein